MTWAAGAELDHLIPVHHPDGDFLNDTDGGPAPGAAKCVQLQRCLADSLASDRQLISQQAVAGHATEAGGSATAVG